MLGRFIFFILVFFYTLNVSAFSVNHDFFVKIGMFDAAKVKFKYSLGEKNYGIYSEVRTNGFFDTVYPFLAQYNTTGIIKKEELIARDYQYTSKSRSKVRSKQVFFDDKGNPISQLVIKNGKESRKEFAPSPTPADTFDLQTILMKIAYQYNLLGFCDAEMAVYDGKRRFDVKVVDVGLTKLEKNEVSPFFGETVQCSMQIKKVLSQEDDTLWSFAANKSIDFWIMRDKTTLHPFMVRVRIKDTPLGELNAYATKIDIEE